MSAGGKATEAQRTLSKQVPREGVGISKHKGKQLNRGTLGLGVMGQNDTPSDHSWRRGTKSG